MKELTKKARYDIDYARTKIKRVPLDMQISEYETLKATALEQGEKVNEYIKKAIRQRMERDASQSNIKDSPENVHALESIKEV